MKSIFEWEWLFPLTMLLVVIVIALLPNRPNDH